MGVRLPADWMQAADERILEYLQEEEVSTPKSISDEDKINYHRKTVQIRIGLLLDIGLVNRVGRGVYTISEEGEAFLKGNLDLREVPDPREEDEDAEAEA